MPKASHRGARSGRIPFAALLAVMALLVQALLPAAAMAAQASGATRIEICTAQGSQSAVIGADGKARTGFMGLPCQDCLAIAAAMTVTPELAVEPIAYALARVRHVEAAALGLRLARAPPRPPSQGPPSDIV
ncbi:MAG TPA: DUF2946 domain-containing protein [Phenylobacterium sp.]|nr:DUF2946 domain-containing protein [Phenylobacterium sp.]